MYRHNLKQLDFVEFSLPFDGRLSPNNKWIKLARVIPWEQFEDDYKQNFSDNDVGNPAFSARLALAALIIKEELGASDRYSVEQITENPYLHYFCRLKEFITQPPFDASMYVHFRKRFPADVIKQVNDAVAKKMMDEQDPPEDPKTPSADKGDSDSDDPPANSGKLLVDATCAPADITYPTDLKLLNDAREKSEEMIDKLHKDRGRGHKKPRTYRRRARTQFLSVARSK
jgi:hypothetical protein